MLQDNKTPQTSIAVPSGVPTPPGATETPAVAEPAAEVQIAALQKQVGDLERLSRSFQSQADTKVADKERQVAALQSQVERLQAQLGSVPLTDEQREALRAAADRAELEKYRRGEAVRTLQVRLSKEFSVPAETFNPDMDENATMLATLQYFTQTAETMRTQVEQLQKEKGLPAEPVTPPGSGIAPQAQVSATPKPTGKRAWIRARTDELVKASEGKRISPGQLALQAEREWQAQQSAKRSPKAQV